MASQQKTGRNSPCPCGSGKKHKACCLEKVASENTKVPLGMSIGVLIAGAVGGGLLLAYKGAGAGLAGLAASVIVAGLLLVLRDPNPPRGGSGDASSINFGR